MGISAKKIVAPIVLNKSIPSDPPGPSGKSGSSIRSIPESFTAFAQIDQRHALRRAARFTDRFHRGANQHTAGCNQHDLVVFAHQRGGNNFAVARALAGWRSCTLVPRPWRVFDDRRALAKAIFRRAEHLLFFVFGHQHSDDALRFIKHHAAYTTGVAAHTAHVVLRRIAQPCRCQQTTSHRARRRSALRPRGNHRHRDRPR